MIYINPNILNEGNQMELLEDNENETTKVAIFKIKDRVKIKKEITIEEKEDD